MSEQEFFDSIKEEILALWDQYGILPSVAAGQAAHESEFGTSDLANNANAIFGIKDLENGVCDEESGELLEGDPEEIFCHYTPEVIDGVERMLYQPFRRYNSFTESIRDYGEFLYTREPYQGALGLTDPEEFLEQLGDYATDPDYTEGVMGVIEQYNLREWDEEVLGNGDDNGDNEINIVIEYPDFDFRRELTPLPPENIEFIIIHHPAGIEYPVEQVHHDHYYRFDEETQQYWSGIGYNYYIEKNNGGIVYEGRGLHVGSHVPGYNSISLGVCLEGDYSQETVDEGDWNILATFVSQLMEEYGVEVENVIGHGEAVSSECPGLHFDMDAFRETLRSGDFSDPIPDPDPEPDPGDPEVYTVQEGDTLSSIANEFGVTVNDLVEWNNLSDPDDIQVGQELIVSAPENGSGEDPEPDPSDSIADIQEWLNVNYDAGLEVDGSFGPATNEAVVRSVQAELNSQYDAGLSIDGSFGPLTQLAWVPQVQGNTGNLVYLIQAQIIGADYDPNGFDGSFGPGLESAVRQFQTDEGITVDGMVGPETSYALFNHTQGWHWDWIPNPDVTIVQQWLNDNYNSGLTLDGSYGPITREETVRAVQTQMNTDYNAGLEVDGSFGPATQAAWQPLTQGDTGNLVQLVQGRLIGAGYDPQGFDGSFGPGMESTVREFQTDQGITVDGFVGPETSYTLFNL